MKKVALKVTTTESKLVEPMVDYLVDWLVD